MIKKIGILANSEKKSALDAAQRACAVLQSKQVAYALENATAAAMGQAPDSLQDVDCLLVIGGDGTILRSAALALSLNVPILGVNFGRIGFLSEVNPDDIESALDQVIRGSFYLESRSMVAGSVEGHTALALNDFSLYKKHHSRTVEVEISINGQPAVRCSCDGVLVSTPTGSTGYALSAGGPIVAPNLPSLLITPICPHALSAKPMIVHPDAVISMQLVQDHYNSAQVCADGDLIFENFQRGQALFVRTAKEHIQFLRLGKHNYYDMVRKKLY